MEPKEGAAAPPTASSWLARKSKQLTRRLPVFYRIRYALITELGGRDFERRPAPRTETTRQDVPGAFSKIVSGLELADDGSFDDIRKIAFDLSYGHRRGPGLGYESVTTLKRIYSEKAGVCSDYSQVFLGLCQAASITAREWGVCASFEGRGVGHTFAEVYLEQYGKWVFLDPLYSIYATHRGDSIPLAVTELVDLTTGGRADGIEIKIIEPDWPNQAKRHAYVDRYLKADHIFFLLSNNEVFKQDRFLRWSRAVPPPILHPIMILTGNYQRFHVYANSQNQELMARRVAELGRWRTRSVMILLAATAMLAAVSVL